jgi:tetratricopeptide (TPR) repeat protein
MKEDNMNAFIIIYLIGLLVSCRSSSGIEEGQEIPTKRVLTTLSQSPSLSGQVPLQVVRETLDQIAALLREQGETAPAPLIASFLMCNRLAGQDVTQSEADQRRLSQWVFQGGDYPPLLLEVIYLKLLQNRFPEVRYYLGRAEKASKSDPFYREAIAHVKNLIAWFKNDRAGALEQMKEQTNYPPAKLMVAQAALQAGFWEEAAEIFKSEKAASAQLGHATALKFLGQHDHARKIYADLFERFPSDKRVYWNYLSVLAQMPGRENELLSLEGHQNRLTGVIPELDQRLTKASEIFRAARARQSKGS